MRTVTFNSIFDIYPDTIQDQEAVIGYRISGKRTRISFPFSLKLRKKIQPDLKGRYRASDIGLEPMTVTTLPPKGKELPESYSQKLFLLLRRRAS